MIWVFYFRSHFLWLAQWASSYYWPELKIWVVLYCIFQGPLSLDGSMSQEFWARGIPLGTSQEWLASTSSSSSTAHSSAHLHLQRLRSKQVNALNKKVWSRAHKFAICAFKSVQGWEFALSHIQSLLFCSKLLRLKSNCERFDHVTP